VRMWNVDPQLMCNKHLMGEHVEMHMFVGTVRAGKSLDGYIRDQLVEPQHIKARHDAVAAEMVARGLNHRTPIDENPDTGLVATIVPERALRELVTRCPDCRDRIEWVTGARWPDIPRGGDKLIDDGDNSVRVQLGGMLINGSYGDRAKALRALELMRRKRQEMV
jgi:hypothetical protein